MRLTPPSVSSRRCLPASRRTFLASMSENPSYNPEGCKLKMLTAACENLTPGPLAAAGSAPLRDTG
eukprot:2193652-Rhodomonas_salina.1